MRNYQINMMQKITLQLILLLWSSLAFSNHSITNTIDTNIISKLNVPIKSIEEVTYESAIVSRFSNDLVPYSSLIIRNKITLATITRNNSDYFLLTIPITSQNDNAVESSILIYFSTVNHIIAKGN